MKKVVLFAFACLLYTSAAFAACDCPVRPCGCGTVAQCGCGK